MPNVSLATRSLSSDDGHSQFALDRGDDQQEEHQQHPERDRDPDLRVLVLPEVAIILGGAPATRQWWNERHNGLASAMHRGSSAPDATMTVRLGAGRSRSAAQTWSRTAAWPSSR